MSKAEPDKSTSAIPNDPAASNQPAQGADGALEDAQLDSVSGGIVVVGTRGARPGGTFTSAIGTVMGVTPDDNKIGGGVPPDDGKTS